MRKASLITNILTWLLIFTGIFLFLLTSGGGFIADNLNGFELIGKVFVEEIPSILSFQNYESLTNVTITFFALILITVVYSVLFILRIRESKITRVYIDLGLFIFTGLILLVCVVVLLYPGNYVIADALSTDNGGLFELASTQLNLGQVPADRLFGSMISAWLFVVSVFGWVVGAILTIIWLSTARISSYENKRKAKKKVSKKIVEVKEELLIEDSDLTVSNEEVNEKVEENVAVEVKDAVLDSDSENLETADQKEGNKIIRIPFAQRIAVADSNLVSQYNELKSYILAYGVNSRISNSGEAFRLHTKTYVKISFAGKSLKLYLALNPSDYKNTTIPFADASNKSIYAEIPFVFKVKSDLSLKRAKLLIDDAMKKDNLVQEEISIHNWAKNLK